MKTILIMSIGLFVSTALANDAEHSCTAATNIISEATWTRASGDWTELEKLGVRKSAEEVAIQDCVESGFFDCVTVSSRIISCSGAISGFGGDCTARAVARGSN